jgi:PAS domain S-box-containing protein
MAELPTLPRRLMIDRMSIVFSTLLIAIGLLTWCGWSMHLEFLVQPFSSDFPPIKANEALCWLLLGASFLAIECGLYRFAWLSALPLLLSVATLAQYSFRMDFHIDELLAKDYLLVDTEYPGRMAPVTAICILLCSAVLLWRGVPQARRARLFAEAVIGAITSSIGFSTLLGFLVNLPAVYRWGSSTAASTGGSLCLLLLGTGLLLHAWRASYRADGTPPSWAPMPPTIICFTMTVILWIGMRERELLFIGNSTQNALNGYAAAIENERGQVDDYITERLVAGWNRQLPERTDLMVQEAASLYEIRRESGCVFVEWISPSLVTQWTWPRARSGTPVGFDHSTDERRASALRAAATKKASVFSGSTTIPGQNQQGFVLYTPVFAGDRLVGFLGAEFSHRGFFSAIDRKLKISTLYDSMVSIGGTGVYGNIAPEHLADNPLAVEISATMQGQRIHIGMAPNADNLQLSRRYLPELILFSGLGITVLLGLSVHFARSARTGMLAAESSNRRLIAENEARRKVDERLKTSDERLRLALDSTGIGIFEWNLASGYVYYSTGLWEMLGYEPGRMSATVESFQSLIHPEDIPSFRRRIDAQVSGQTQFIEPEFRVRSHSGEWRWLCLRAKSVNLNASGAPRRIIGTIQDLTARREAEDALRASQAATRKLSLVASRTDNPVAILSPDGRVEWINESFTRSLEFPLSELVGKKLPECLSGADTDARTISRIRYAYSQGHSINADLVQYSKSGRLFHLSYDIQPVRNRSSEIENFIAVAADITARVEMERALRRAKSEADSASRAKSEFLASMSHEIRTPMNGVIGMTSLLLDTPLTHDQREYVNTIRNSGESLLAIINDILDFSKIESGKMELERQPLDLGSCIEESIELFSVQAFSKNIELVFHIDKAVPGTILGDVVRLRQVLINLINNAVKFTERGSIAVEVGLAPGDPAAQGVPPGRLLLEFRVQDTGVGIPADRLDRLFKVFSQVDSSTTRRFGGTGLGLAICDRLCSLMGGSIHVESTAGHGSCFIFTIQTEPASAGFHDPLPSIPPPLVSGLVLAFAQHPVGRKRLASLLDAWGVRSQISSSAEELLAQARELADPPTILVLDYDLRRPRELIETLAPLRLPRLVMIPFGFAPPDLPDDGHPYAFISKPLRGYTLYQTVSNIFSAIRANTGTRNPLAPVEQVLGELIPLEILLVEDNPVNQKVAIRFLERLGYKASVASNGSEAVRAVADGRYHLVIMDLQMPEMDGLEASRRIRASLPAERQPKIIALTANALRGDREACMEAGMNDYITKPIRIQEIAEAIKRQFGN